MYMRPEDELAALDRKFWQIAVLDAPACLLFFVGLMAMLEPETYAFLPFLESKSVTTLMLVIGGPVYIWCSLQLFVVLKRRKELIDQGVTRPSHH